MPFPISGNIYFTGFMATGKSRIGSLTAASLGWKFFDIDKLVESREGRNIAEVFSQEGEAYFRAREIEMLQSVSTEKDAVVALGGGTLTQPEALRIVKETGVVVCLWASPEVILARVNRKKAKRPLLADLDDEAKMAKIKGLMEARRAVYEQADLRFESTEGLPHHVLTRRIIHRLQVEQLNPLRVELGSRSYPIYVEASLASHADTILEKSGCPGPFILVTDQNLRCHQKHMLDRIRACLGNCKVFYFKPGEEEKNLKSLNRLFTYLIRNGYGRGTTLVSFSGGVVGDMTGFAAAVYLRGVRYVQMPTTLLSMVDSSVGGKTGVNHPLGKNMIGAFYQPKAVVANLAALKTLPESEYQAGLAEVVKYAVIRDEGFFRFLEERRGEVLARDSRILGEVVRRCCAIKADIVARDETETGLRAILNYGHTFGHALELLAGYRLSHGLAVALGMRAAARLAVLLNLLDPREEERQSRLLDALGLPRQFPQRLDPERAWEAMGRDKKADRGRRIFILPMRIGAAKPVGDVDKGQVLAALDILAGDAGAPAASGTGP